jgi:hypothetical protein
MATKHTVTVYILPVRAPAEVTQFAWTEREKPKNPMQMIDWDAGPGYDALKKFIVPELAKHNGREGNLERVAVLLTADVMISFKALTRAMPADMFVDDEGAVPDHGLPRNEQATAIYRNNWLTNNKGTDPETLPAIYGCAILFMGRVWF